MQEVAGILEETLNEEKKADAKLTQIGESVMNARAENADCVTTSIFDEERNMKLRGHECVAPL